MPGGELIIRRWEKFYRIMSLPLDSKLNRFPKLIVEHLFVKFGDRS